MASLRIPRVDRLLIWNTRPKKVVKKQYYIRYTCLRCGNLHSIYVTVSRYPTGEKVFSYNGTKASNPTELMQNANIPHDPNSIKIIKA